MPAVTIETRCQRSPNHVKILLREISTMNWGVRGGQAACDLDLGFKIAV